MPGIDSIAVDVQRTTEVTRTPRVMQLESLFDIAPSKQQTKRWDVSLPLADKPWNVGLIVGPSGAGKTSVARAAFGDAVVRDFPWPEDKAVIDGFPDDMGIKDVNRLLGSVGFNTPPAWLRPYGTLSTGEQFRVTVARALAEMPELVAIDEFTSTVDRQIAQVASATIAEAVRKRDRQFVAITCHYDVIDWLQPDWVYQPHTNTFTWRSVQPRPQVELEIVKADRKAWGMFAPHHYLSGELASGASCHVALHDGEPIGFVAYMHFPHAQVKNMKKGHRLVVLPDWQGLGIGIALATEAADIYHEQGFRVTATMVHPAMVYSMAQSPRWQLKSRPNTKAQMMNTSRQKALKRRALNSRRLITYGFEYVAEANAAPDEMVKEQLAS